MLYKDAEGGYGESAAARLCNAEEIARMGGAEPVAKDSYRIARDALADHAAKHARNKHFWGTREALTSALKIAKQGDVEPVAKDRCRKLRDAIADLAVQKRSVFGAEIALVDAESIAQVGGVEPVPAEKYRNVTDTQAERVVTAPCVPIEGDLGKARATLRDIEEFARKNGIEGVAKDTYRKLRDAVAEGAVLKAKRGMADEAQNDFNVANDIAKRGGVEPVARDKCWELWAQTSKVAFVYRGLLGLDWMMKGLFRSGS